MFIARSGSTVKSFSTSTRLGVAPAVVGATVAGVAALAALAALVANSMDDDWSDSSVFEANMRKVHSAMLSLQCVVGGAQAGSPLIDTFGNTICAGGTKVACKLSSAQLNTWRTLREGFGMFWSDVQSFNNLTGPSDADAKQAKQFARDFFSFYSSLKNTCSKQGVQLTQLPSPPPTKDDEPVAAWVKYAAWGIGGVAVIALAVSAKSIFGRG